MVEGKRYTKSGRRQSSLMEPQLRRLQQTLNNVHQALEDLESALLDFEGAFFGGGQEQRPQSRVELDLLSISKVCQGLGMGKSWVYRRIKSGEIPSIKLGHNIKVRREDLEEYLEARRYHPLDEEQPPSGE